MSRCHVCEWAYCADKDCTGIAYDDAGLEMDVFEDAIERVDLAGECARADQLTPLEGLASLGMIAAAVDVGAFDRRDAIGVKRAKKLGARKENRARAAAAMRAVPPRAPSVPLAPNRNEWRPRQQDCCYEDDYDLCEHSFDLETERSDPETKQRRIDNPDVELVALLPKHQRDMVSDHAAADGASMERLSRASYAERFGDIIADVYGSPDNFPWGVFFARMDVEGQTASDALLQTMERTLNNHVNEDVASGPSAQEDAALSWAISASENEVAVASSGGKQR